MKNNKGISSILIIPIVALALVAGGIYYFWSKNSQKQVACTMEAKICPDGSSVGRTGPNCEFAACPIDETANWKTYEWGDMSFKYPSNWTVEKEYYSTPVQQAAGESAENIGLLIYPTNDQTNYIHIDGRQNSCEESQGHVKCTYEEDHCIFTDSKNQEVLKIFDQMLPTFNFDINIKTGEIKIDYQALQTVQDSVNQGHQPWRINPDNVVSAEILQYGFVQADLSSLKLTSQAASAAINDYEIIHNSKTYVIRVIQVVPGEGQIWTLSSIKLK